MRRQRHSIRRLNGWWFEVDKVRSVNGHATRVALRRMFGVSRAPPSVLKNRREYGSLSETRDNTRSRIKARRRRR